MPNIRTFFAKDTYRASYAVMLVAAAAAFLAAFTLSVEKITLLKDPDAVLSCSVNLVLNCAGVMNTPQASLFGFPNSYLGIMGFAIVITVAMGALLGKVRYSKAFLLTALAGYTLGLTFAYWLFFQSVYVIQILCPWCLVVTAMTTIVFAAMLRINLRENTFGFSKSTSKLFNYWLDKQYDIVEVIAWLVLLTVLVIIQFGNGLFA